MKKYNREIIFAIILLIWPFVIQVPTNIQFLINLAGINVIVAIGLNILMGYAGQISLGHAGFLAIGAYTSAILTINFKIPFILALVLAGIITGIMGLVLGVPALRLHGHYLAIATLGFGVALTQILSAWKSLSGGFSGIKPPKPQFLGLHFINYSSYYYLVLICMILLIIFAINILKTKTGRALMAMRDSEVAAYAMGINISKYKLIAFVISAFYTGIAGSLYGHLLGFITPYDYSFSLLNSLNYLAMIVIGGLGSIEGSIYGALFLTFLPEFVHKIPLKNLNQVITGIMMILVIMFFPYGIKQLINKFSNLLKVNFKTLYRKEGTK